MKSQSHDIKIDEMRSKTLDKQMATMLLDVKKSVIQIPKPSLNKEYKVCMRKHTFSY